MQHSQISDRQTKARVNYSQIADRKAPGEAELTFDLSQGATALKLGGMTVACALMRALKFQTPGSKP